MSNGDNAMSGPMEILMVQLLQSGIVAQNNFITAQKIIDYDHLEYKRVMTINETVALKMILGIPTDSA